MSTYHGRIVSPDEKRTPSGKPSLTAERRAKDFADAEKRGFTIVRPGADELLLDLDRPIDVAFMVDTLAILKDNGFPFEETKRIVSKSGHLHVYLKAPRAVTPLERLALQAMLGSDRKRELLGFLRIENEVPDPTVFFEKVPVPDLLLG